jgi:hypothetical protein
MQDDACPKCSHGGSWSHEFTEDYSNDWWSWCWDELRYTQLTLKKAILIYFKMTEAEFEQEVVQCIPAPYYWEWANLLRVAGMDVFMPPNEYLKYRLEPLVSVLNWRISHGT